MSADTSFLGRGWSFPPQFGRTGGLQMVEEGEDIRQSLHILLSTAPGERVMQPAYGCGLRQLVFGSMDDSLVTEIRDLVERAVRLYEARIDLHSVAVDDSALIEGLLRIELSYTVRSTNSRDNFVYPFYLNDGDVAAAE